jgi:hypothetical protein
VLSPLGTLSPLLHVALQLSMHCALH